MDGPTRRLSAPVLLAISSIVLSSPPSKVSKTFIRSADLSTAFAIGCSGLVSSISSLEGAVLEQYTALHSGSTTSSGDSNFATRLRAASKSLAVCLDSIS